MKNTLRAYPLLTIDPYLSYWSTTNQLNKSDVKHWTGKVKPIKGDVLVDGKTFRFMGKGKDLIKQTKRNVSPMFTIYTFKNEQIKLDVTFWSPMLLEDPVVFSRPTPYIDFEVTILDGKKHDVKVVIEVDESHCYDLKRDADIIGDDLINGDFATSYLGKRQQPVLESSGDDLRINWGYLFLSVNKENGNVTYVDEERKSLKATLDLSNVNKGFVIYGYDDIVSINYYGDVKPGYWRKKYDNIKQAIQAAHKDHDELLAKCIKRNKELLSLAKKSGGAPLQSIATAAYRQAIAAHKVTFDNNDELLFISKENFSNGCAATVDVTYPSIPLFLLYNPDLVLGMVRPILKCARLDYWIYDFAPHDAGRYPYVTGNVYGMNHETNLACRVNNGDVHIPYYLYDKDESLFDLKCQMPVEECGNMLILLFVTCELLKDKQLLQDNIDLLEQWVKYLVKFGQDPGNQLCTDDFAGHLAHNANLAVKSILGIEAFAQIKRYLGEEKTYEEYHKLAKQFAKEWENKASRGDHTCLAFDKEDGWSLKYNLIWDRYFASDLFSQKLFDSEIDWYIKKVNKFGTPLDSRKDYTKSDWIVWVTCLTDDIEKRKVLLKPIETYINCSKTRVPFSDWYETILGTQVGFQARSVQGGCFATILLDKKLNK